MLSGYKIENTNDEINALKEIIQEIVLLGLSRGGFFDEGAFYDGTALRIFYGLDRYSEDLDFSLMTTDPSFNFENFIPPLEDTLKSLGLNVEIDIRNKVKDSAIKSAFLKGNTIEHLLIFYPENKVKGINPEAKIKIKFEVDIDPPSGANYQIKYRLLPSPYSVTLYDEPSLFAGKINAVIFRTWKSRVKGRDLYDYIFYLSKEIKVNLNHLEARMKQSGDFLHDDKLSLEDVKELLIDRFNKIDYEEAKIDVIPFIKDKSKLDIWSKEFFISITKDLQVE